MKTVLCSEVGDAEEFQLMAYRGLKVAGKKIGDLAREYGNFRVKGVSGWVITITSLGGSYFIME